MHRLSFGTVGFMGILMPGALFTANIIIPLSVNFGSFENIVKTVNYKADTMLFIFLILISFTAGTILRSFPPKWAEWPYRCLSDWCFDKILSVYLSNPKKELFKSIPDDIWKNHYDPATFDAEVKKLWRYQRLFNFAKNYVIANSERLASEVQRAEGLSRFTASVFWCSLTGVLISTTILFNALIMIDKPLESVNIAMYFGITNLLFLVGSAWGIGTIRQHEGEVVMQSFFCIQPYGQNGRTGSHQAK